MLAGCGESSSDDDGDKKADTSGGTIVDPYIEGAVLCIDSNKDGICGSDEPTSTASDDQGRFTFSQTPEAGDVIRIKTQGTHNGREYDLNMSATLSDTDGFVISPLTTLQDKNITAAQITQIMEQFGLTLTQTQVTGDPMDGLDELSSSTVTDAELARIRASIAVYGTLRIMEGSEAIKRLTGEQFVASATDTENGVIYQILDTMTDYVKEGLSTSNITSLTNAVTGNPNAPAVSVLDIVNTAVAITDYMTQIGYTACNESNGSLSAIQQALNDASSNGTNLYTWSNQLGQGYYGARNRITFRGYINGGWLNEDDLPQELRFGLDCDSGFLFIDTNSTVDCR